MDPSDSRPLLTIADVQAWRDDKSQLEKQIRDCQSRLAEINQKLDAAALFLPDNAKDLAADEDSEDITLPDLICSILESSPQGLTKKEIMKQIKSREIWRKRMEASANYFYTVMMRLEKRAKVIRDGKQFRLPDSEGAPSHAKRAAGAPSIETGNSHPGNTHRGSVNPEREVGHDNMI